MTQFSQKYTIVQLLEPLPEGAQFSSHNNWPLHSTVVGTFAIDWDEATMTRRLEELLASHAKAISIAEDDTFFGDEKQIRVVLLQKTDSLVKLHYDVVAMLEEGGLKLNDPQFAREGFLPHATVQTHTRLHKGDEVIFNALTIIDMFPDGNPYERRVIKTIPIIR